MPSQIDRVAVTGVLGFAADRGLDLQARRAAPTYPGELGEHFGARFQRIPVLQGWGLRRSSLALWCWS